MTKDSLCEIREWYDSGRLLHYNVDQSLSSVGVLCELESIQARTLQTGGLPENSLMLQTL
jgi:hypothetical protein